MNTNNKFLATAFLTTLLIGCGGGGGGATDSDSVTDNTGSGISQPPVANLDVIVPEESAQITSQNGVDVARVSMDVFDTLKGVSSATNVGITHLTGDGRTPGPRQLIVASSCLEGGQVHVSGHVAIMSTVRLSYADCQLNGVLYNGGMTVNIVAVNGTPGDSNADWFYSGAVQPNDFTITIGDRRMVMSGEFDLTVVHTRDTEIPGGVALRFQGTNDEVVMLREGDDASRLLKFDLNWGYRNFQPSRYAASFGEGRLASTLIDGQVTIESESTYGGYDAEVPSGGAMLVYGAGGSNLAITAMGSGAVEIAVDANGNANVFDSDDRVYNGMWSDYFARW